MIQAQKKAILAPNLHLSKGQKRFYKNYSNVKITQPDDLLNPSILKVPKAKFKLLISGQKSEKFQQIRAQLKHNRGTFFNKQIQKQKEASSPEYDVHKNKQIGLKKQQQRNKSPKNKIVRQRSYQKSFEQEKREKQFEELVYLRNQFFIRKQFILQQRQSMAKQRAKMQPKVIRNGYIQQQLNESQLSSSLHLNHLKPKKLKQMSISQRYLTPTNRNNQVNLTTFISKDKRKKFRRLAASVHQQRVVDSSIAGRMPISNRQKYSDKMYESDTQPEKNPSEYQQYERFKQDNQDLLQRLSKLLYRKQNLAFLQKLSTDQQIQ